MEGELVIEALYQIYPKPISTQGNENSLMYLAHNLHKFNITTGKNHVKLDLICAILRNSLNSHRQAGEFVWKSATCWHQILFIQQPNLQEQRSQTCSNHQLNFSTFPLLPCSEQFFCPLTVKNY